MMEFVSQPRFVIKAFQRLEISSPPPYDIWTILFDMVHMAWLGKCRMLNAI